MTKNLTLAQKLGIAPTHPKGWDIKLPVHEDQVYPDWKVSWDLPKEKPCESARS